MTAFTGTALDYTVQRLEDLVVNHAAGTHLPAESALAEQLGVSRLTVREALKVLAGRGLVRLSRGRRPLVLRPDGSVMAHLLAIAIRRDPGAVLELNTIRTSLEVLSATEAAKRSNRAGLAALRSALEAMDTAARGLDGTAESIHRYNSADVGFHEALALASGNQMLAILLESLSESLQHSFAQSFEGYTASGRDVLDAVQEHRKILDSVTVGDAVAAEKIMRSHLENAAKDLSRYERDRLG